MNKHLLAAALLSALATSAFAANVTLYGVVDTGFSFKNTSVDGADDVRTFQMKTNQQAGNRVGLKGTEDLGNGFKVGFVLENGFNEDSGELAQNGRLFGREAIVYLDGAFGQVAFGRTSQLAAGVGSYAISGGAVNAFSTGWGGVGNWANVTNGNAARYDNTITYRSPAFAGLLLYAQYSMKTDSKSDTTGTENKASTDRYYGLGATYRNGAFNAVAIVDSINYKSTEGSAREDDAVSVFVGGGYDFGSFKILANGRWFQDAASFSALSFASPAANTTTDGKLRGVDGYGFNVGVNVPAFGGIAKAQIGWGHGEYEVEGSQDAELDILALSAGYIYNFSKRTAVYCAADFKTGDYNAAAKTGDTDVTEVIVGLTHRF
ncbi:porin [Sutterella sp.]|uniref:porin n=1 Tax=Sutterella sp. TaxID=1981025 RepID=UPI0026DF662C|nr:porin [Sutterella sp.]MDO5532408.1 porin [Sutterella sp.]